MQHLLFECQPSNDIYYFRKASNLVKVDGKIIRSALQTQ